MSPLRGCFHDTGPLCRRSGTACHVGWQESGQGVLALTLSPCGHSLSREGGNRPLPSAPLPSQCWLKDVQFICKQLLLLGIQQVKGGVA